MARFIKLRSSFLTLLLGFVGGLLFYAAQFPMPWLIGAMVTLAVVAVCGKVSLDMPKPISNGLLGLLGLMVGSTLDPELVSNAHNWWLTLAALPVLLILQFVLVQVLLKYMAAHESFSTRFFGGAAGGLIEMVTLAREKGGDERSVLVMHMLRLSLLVFFAPVFFSVTLQDGNAGRDLAGFTSGLLSYGWANTGLLILCWFGGIYGGRILRLPASNIMGPFLMASIFYGADILNAQPPYAIMILAQIGVGAELGSRFAGYSLKRIRKLLLPTLVLTFALTSVSAFVAWGAHIATGLSFAVLFLAYMPGGMTQMSLIALALNLNAGFVMVHLIARVFLVVLLAPVCYKWMEQFFEPSAKQNHKEEKQ